MSAVPVITPGMTGSSQRYAEMLLHSLGQGDVAVEPVAHSHPAVSAACSGLMTLTGERDASPKLCPVPIAACADGALLALRSLVTGANDLGQLLGSQLLTERAALLRLARNGRISAGGSCRLLDAADARIAINLAREDDWALLPALFESDVINGERDQWEVLESLVKQHSAAELVERGHQLGLPIARDAMPLSVEHWCRLDRLGQQAIPRKQPLVLDLSTLWAGPLCSHLLQYCGARVIKVESTKRPDGARQGNADFYDLLNQGKQSLSLDLESVAGRALLKRLIAQADIVIESARPRGLRQMGIVAEELIAGRAGLTWVSITGHGRLGEQAEWVGFGDDAGVEAGLSSLMELVTGQAMFVGDAIADPLTGMHAALAAWHSHLRGGGRLVSLALAEVTRYCIGFDLPDSIASIRQRHQRWLGLIGEGDIQTPQPRYASTSAASLGAHTQDILTEFSLHP